jgi:hypothetical protein
MVRKFFVWSRLAKANGKEGFFLAVDFSQRNKKRNKETGLSYRLVSHRPKWNNFRMRKALY